MKSPPPCDMSGNHDCKPCIHYVRAHALACAALATMKMAQEEIKLANFREYKKPCRAVIDVLQLAISELDEGTRSFEAKP